MYFFSFSWQTRTKANIRNISLFNLDTFLRRNKNDDGHLIRLSVVKLSNKFYWFFF